MLIRYKEVPFDAALCSPGRLHSTKSRFIGIELSISCATTKGIGGQHNVHYRFTQRD